MKIVNYIYDIYLKWYNKKYFKRYTIRKFNQFNKYNPFTILQFYLIFLTLFIMTGGIIMTIILMIQS